MFKHFIYFVVLCTFTNGEPHQVVPDDTDPFHLAVPQQNQGYCIVSGQAMAEGQSYRYPDRCAQLLCAGGRLLIQQCNLSPPPTPNCKLIEGNPNAPFPNCCNQYLCFNPVPVTTPVPPFTLPTFPTYNPYTQPGFPTFPPVNPITLPTFPSLIPPAKK